MYCMVKMLLFPYTGILVPVHTPWSNILVRLLICLYNHTQTLTSLLSWFKHISITIKKAKRLLDLISRNFYSNSSPLRVSSPYTNQLYSRSSNTVVQYGTLPLPQPPQLLNLFNSLLSKLSPSLGFPLLFTTLLH